MKNGMDNEGLEAVGPDQYAASALQNLTLPRRSQKGQSLPN
jgi:hypothetical protein